MTDCQATAPITVLLVDDQLVVRESLRMFLATAPDIRVVGEAENGHEALRKAIELKPCVILLDVAMPQLSGAETARRILRELPGVKILAFSTCTEKQTVLDVMAAGVTSYVSKNTAPDHLPTAIRATARGVPFFSPAITTLLP